MIRFLVLLFVCVQLVAAHCKIACSHDAAYTNANLEDVFSMLSVNGGPASEPWQYVRKVVHGWAYTPGDTDKNIFNPQYELYDANIRCGRGAATSGAGVETLVVNAGDEISFFPTQQNEQGQEVNAPASVVAPS
jgi:hypothetical protein